jgi:hypothetical protein
MSQRLPFLMQMQGASEWCWSAVAVSIDDFRSPPSRWTQCLLVNQRLRRSDCCEPLVPALCNCRHELSLALIEVGRLDGVVHIGRPPDSMILQQIDQGRPVALRIEWHGSNLGHFVAIVGYDDSDPGNLQFVIADPRGSDSTVNAATFPGIYQSSGGAWTHSYFTL